MFLQDTLESIKSKVSGGGVKKDPAGLFDYNAAESGAVPGGTQVAQTYLAGKNAYGKALAGYNQQRTATAQGFGYQGDIDPNTGMMSNLRVDQTNPYGAYQMNRRAHADQWTALRDQQAGRRIGSKGLAAQSQNDARFAWGGEDAAQAQDFIGRLSGIDQQQQQAYQGWQDTYWQALAQATRDAVEKGNFDSATWAGLPDDYGSDAATDEVPAAGRTTSGVKKKAPYYNPAAYVPGGSSAAVAKAIQKKGRVTPAKAKLAAKLTAAQKGLIAEQRATQAAARPVIKKKK